MDTHTLIPDAFLLTAKRLPSGTVVLVQDADNGQQTIIIPPQFIAAVCQGIYDVSCDETTNTDATLIVDLLTACRAVQTWLSREWYCDDDHDDDGREDMLWKLGLAVAKAEGRR